MAYLRDIVGHIKGAVFKSKDYQNDGIAVVRVSDFEGESINLDNLYYVSNEVAAQNRKVTLKTYDVVITTVGATAGNFIRVPREADGFLLNQNTVRLRVKTGDELDQIYLFYALKNKNFKEYLLTGAQGSAQPSIVLDQILGAEIEYPDADIRKKIAKCLFDYDKKIQLNTQTNQTLEQIAQAIYKSWFVDFEPTRAKAAVLAAGGSAAEAQTAAMAALSGQTPAALAALAQQNPARHQQLATLAAAFPSALFSIDGYGEVPQGWEVKKVGDIAKIVKGKKPKNVYPSQENNLLPHILVAALGGRYVEFCKIEKMAISEITDTLVLMDGSASGKVAIGHHGVVGSTLAKMELSNRKYWAILHQFLKMKERDIQDNTTGTSIPHADKARINNYSLIVCDGFILDYYNQLFENTLFQSIHNRKQNHLLENIRDTLLPKLLSGELPHALG